MMPHSQCWVNSGSFQSTEFVNHSIVKLEQCFNSQFVERGYYEMNFSFVRQTGTVNRKLYER